jgi:hypothetical protein
LKNLIKVVAIVLVLALAALSQQVIQNSIENQVFKTDYAEINHMKYGIFSVDEWKKQLEVVVADEIGEFQIFTKPNEHLLKERVEGQLGVLIDQVEEKIKSTNKGSLKGRIKQTVFNSLVDMKEIKAGIPKYADAMLEELKKAKTEQKLKRVVKTQVSKMFKKTHDVNDRTELNALIERYGTKDIDEAKTTISSKMAEKQKQITEQSSLMVGISAFLFLLIGLQRRRLSPLEYFALLWCLFIMLAVGVSTPMIDMEAKIGSMSFVLMNHEVGFTDQVMYFQSKSIFDVFVLMISHPDLQVRFIGILIILFSVVFPITKLISTCFYYFDIRGTRNNRIVQFFVLKSGKWSMSDVLVVAIFMSYVGFKGVVSSQLEKMGTFSSEIDLITTNGTQLQPGFYVFTTYVLLGLLFSIMITKVYKSGK